MPNSRLALYTVVQDRLTAATGQTLAEFIMVRRTPGGETPYRHIAQELVDLTGVDITHEAVRRWYHKVAEEAAANTEADETAAYNAAIAAVR